MVNYVSSYNQTITLYVEFLKNNWLAILKDLLSIYFHCHKFHQGRDCLHSILEQCLLHGKYLSPGFLGNRARGTGLHFIWESHPREAGMRRKGK